MYDKITEKEIKNSDQKKTKQNPENLPGVKEIMKIWCGHTCLLISSLGKETEAGGML